jgi:hypothetical protein
MKSVLRSEQKNKNNERVIVWRWHPYKEAGGSPDSEMINLDVLVARDHKRKLDGEA